MDIADETIADDFLTGGLKRSPSYHRHYGRKTYGEIKELARKKPRDRKAQEMKKLIEQGPRLLEKLRGSRP